MIKFLLALLPIIWLIVAMSVLKMPGYRACLIAFLITAVTAVAFWRMPWPLFSPTISRWRPKPWIKSRPCWPASPPTSAS